MVIQPIILTVVVIWNATLSQVKLSYDTGFKIKTCFLAGFFVSVIY